MATKAKQQRQLRALQRFHVFKRDDVWPHVNIRRFRTDEEWEVYVVRKMREKAALTAAMRDAAIIPA